jgi:DNA (cytosine-5)-methyltransferase 1
LSHNGPVDINLFAGAGGMAVGLSHAGFSPLRLYEIDPYCCETLRHNIESDSPTVAGDVLEGDVQRVDWRGLEGQVRLIAAAAPCQPFSLAGKHRAEHDGRNLFPEVMRAVRELRPTAVLLENVRGLLRNAFQPYFEYILRQLECPSIRPKPNELWRSHNDRIRRQQRSVGYEPEYNVTWRLLDAADYGVPQNRQRVFIVATRRDLREFRFPSPTHSRGALLQVQSSGEYWKRHNLARPERLPGNGANPVAEAGRLPWLTVRDAITNLPKPSPSERAAPMNHWSIPGAKAYVGHKGSMLDWPSKTIKAGVHGVPGGENTVVDDDGTIRYYTLREAACLQTFPEAHHFRGARIHVTRQVGNAVPCKLVAAVGRSLLALLPKETAIRVMTEVPK